jgi:hypothetical protein
MWKRKLEERKIKSNKLVSSVSPRNFYSQIESAQEIRQIVKLRQGLKVRNKNVYFYKKVNIRNHLLSSCLGCLVVISNLQTTKKSWIIQTYLFDKTFTWKIDCQKHCAARSSKAGQKTRQKAVVLREE